MDLKSEFSKGVEREAQREEKQTMTSLTIELLSLKGGREK